MICIFCKKSSVGSKSVEHIVPESLGNLSQVLPIGIVCDKCNNYFARKVEKPFMELEAIRLLRFNQSIPSKKGKVPPVKGLLNSVHDITINRHLNKPYVATVKIESSVFDKILEMKQGTIMFKKDSPLPSGKTVSRFLAKVALEAFAQRIVSSTDSIKRLANEEEFDPIRDHARVGKVDEWSVHVRRIYDTNKNWVDEKNNNVQIIHEYDILYTDLGELYFILSLFGLEFAINYGGASVGGYIRWLDMHNQVSPLYYKENKHVTKLRSDD
ncbi:MAG: hypothetical protein JEZ08_16835 [Clostridiales bacterium]|nr:hypothetical protein [Clostridiales bacterium]